MNNKITCYKINKENKTINIVLENDETFLINIEDDKNSEDILKLIDEVNRRYSVIIYTNPNNKRDLASYGCLTTKCVGLNNIPLTFVNPKYIINIFLQLLQCLFRDDIRLERYFKRDEATIKIPTSEENISLLVDKLLHIFNKEEDMNTKINDDEDDTYFNIKDLFSIIIEYLIKLQNSNKIQKKISNGSFLKNASFVGGINIEALGNLRDDFNETILQTGDIIHKSLYDNKNEVYKQCRENIDLIIQTINEDSDTDLYANMKISFKFMMQMIGEFFKALFVNILPRKSMLNSIYAILYHAAVLNELNILDYYSNLIQLPLLYRLIYSCYKDDNMTDPKYHQYLKENHNSIYKNIQNLCEDEEAAKALEAICEIASKLDIRDINQLDSVYWVLNEKRGYTLEFYVIIITTLYVRGKCSTMNKSNKLLNAKLFIEPIYNLLRLFHKYIVYDINDLNAALCTNTFDHFSKIYSVDIQNVLHNFSKNIHK